MNPDDEPRHDPSALPEGESGLFSQLPKTRPGTRSPRRAGTKAQSAGTKKAANRTTKTADAGQQTPAAIRAQRAAADAAERADFDPLEPPAEETAGGSAEHGARRTEEAEEERSIGPGSLEDLAWAGVAVTAEAATLGIRLLGRAVDAARRATDRN
jgi:hypothetical protein